MSPESTPKERLERLVVLMKRSRKYARSTAAIALVLCLLSLLLALTTKRIYRSETTVIYRDAVRTGRDAESPTQRAARLGPRLKEYVLSRSRLQSVIEQFDLYPELVERSMLDATDEMQKHISFRTRSQDTFALSFSHDNPEIAQAVTARLAETMIGDYTNDNLDSALTTHDLLRVEVDAAQKHVEESSRGLARFLAKHPQFTWGLGDSPYAAVQPLAAGPGTHGPATAIKEKPSADPVLAQRLEQLRIVDGELAGGQTNLPPALVTDPEAQKQRDAAAAALAAAQADLEVKLRKVTMAHPDATSAKSRVDRARAAFVEAEHNLTQAYVGTPPPPAQSSSLDPARRAELETQQKSLVAQIAARRAGAKPKDAAAAPIPISDGPDVVELETGWHRLRLDLERARDAFRKAEDKERAARLLATSAEREVQESLIIADAAYRPVHPESGRGRVFFAGAFIAIFIALGYAGARVLLCDTLFDEGDVIALGGPGLLVSVPHIRAITPPSNPSMVATIRSAQSSPLSTSQNLQQREKTAAEPEGVELQASDEAASTDDEPERRGEDGSSIAMDVPDQPSGSASAMPLNRPISLPANALRPYARHYDTPNVVVVGVPYEPTHEGAVELVRGSPQRVLGALRVLRHRLEQRRGGESLVVSVQSPYEGEGKTTVAARLALTLAEAERARVVLVEGNLARPKLAATLGLRVPDELGLTMQLRRHMGGHDEPWSVVRMGASLYALVESAEEAAFPAAIHSTWFGSAIHALKETYDYVVLDGCAVLDAGDANVLEEVSDVVVLVARSGVTGGSSLVTAARQLGDRRLFGVVLNDVD